MKRLKTITFTFMVAISFTKFAHAKNSNEKPVALKQEKNFDKLTFDEKLDIAIANQEQFYADYRDDFKKASSDIKSHNSKQKTKIEKDEVTLEEKLKAAAKKQKEFYAKLYKNLVKFLGNRGSTKVTSECSAANGPGQGYGEMKLSALVLSQFSEEQIQNMKKELGSCLVTPESSIGLLANTSMKASSVSNLNNSKAAK